MKRQNILALLLAAVAFPLIGLAYVPFLQELRRNVAINQGDEILRRLVWYSNTFHRASPTLQECHVPLEDRGPEVGYRVDPVDSTRFCLVVRWGKLDSVQYDSKLGVWE